MLEIVYENVYEGKMDEYFIIGNSLLGRKDLNVFAIAVYGVLRRYAGHNDGAFPSYETIAKRGKISRRHVIRVMKLLIEIGLVHKNSRYNTENGKYSSNLYSLYHIIDNYFRVENALFDRDDIDVYEIVVYIVLCYYANNNESAIVSYETIAEDARISSRQVIRVVKSLIEKGLVVKGVKYENGTNKYYLRSAKLDKENKENKENEAMDTVIAELQEEIKKVTGYTIDAKEVARLLTNSTHERIRYHLDNWYIHKQYQKGEGAGWFIAVVSYDINPEKYDKRNQRDHFEQRDYSDEELEKYYVKFDDNE